MNKLFTKIAVASLSLAMAVGVGVAVSQSAKDAQRVEAASQTWELVESAPSDWSGEYILCSGSSGTVKYLDGSSFSSGSASGVDVTVSNKKITVDDSDSLTIAKSETSGKYTIKINGKYVGRNANSNGLDASDTWTSNLDNAISYSSSRVVIAGNGGRVLLWLSSNSNFKYYSSGNSHTTQLFKKVATTPTITLSDSTLNVGVGEDATFTITTSALTENFSISGIDEDYITATYTPSSENGEHTVTLHGEALTSSPITLTVSSAGATSQTIDINVVEDVIYEKATKTSDIKDGRQLIIVSSSNNYVLGKYVSGNNSPALGCTLGSDNKFHSSTLPSDYAVLTVTGTTDSWTLTDQDDNIYYGESGQNRLKASSSATDTWSISIDSSTGEATITSAASSRSIMKNTSSALFATYASGQTSVFIYMVPTTDPAISVSVTSGSTSMVGGDSATLTAELLNGATGTVNWSKSNNNVTLSDETGLTTTVTSVASGSSTVTASLTNGSTVDPVDIVFTIRGGSETVPYTVAEARAAIDADEGLTDVYTHGIVSQVDSFNSTYGSITYWISDDGTTTNQLEVYSGLDLNQQKFADINGVMLGDTVTVRGNLKKYKSIYEYDMNNYLTSHTHAAVTVTSIDSITGTLDAVVGAESWDLSGLVVNGTLNSGSSQDITNYVTKTTSAVPGSAGTTTVDVVVTAKSDYGTATKTIGVSATVREVTGPLTDGGRYYIMNHDKTRGLSAVEASANPAGVDLTSSNSLLAFDVKLTDNNTYEFTTTISGVKYYLVHNSTGDNNQQIRITSSPESGLKTKSWLLDTTGVETVGAYHVMHNYSGTANKYLAYYTDDVAKWDWRGYNSASNGDPEIQFVAEKYYAEQVADKILESCASGGSTTYDATAWGQAKDLYNAITISGEIGFLKNGHADKESSDKIERALEKYDYAVARYKLTGADAFITDRVPGTLVPDSNLFVMNSEATTAIIVIVTLASITAIGAIFFIRRRRYN